ncbi:sensor histidine kinase [Fibrella aquatica]|uniref:sensor histidine kinase n=1 Tax=Fibrella aquatica TaxID=3242487 RepID=UPI00352043AC
MKAILIAGLLVCLCKLSVAKPKEFKLFQDYYIKCMNLDSLEKVVYDYRDNSKNYLHQLLWLEMSRRGISDSFGVDLATIKQLANKYEEPLSTATYHYLESLKVRESNLAGATRSELEALRLFKEMNDTTGILASYVAFLALNADRKGYFVNKVQTVGFYFDAILAIGYHAKNPLNRLIAYETIFHFERRIKKVQDFQKRTDLVEISLELIRTYPYLEPAKLTLLMAIAAFYDRHKQHGTSLQYMILASEVFKKRDAKPYYTLEYNLSMAYYENHMYNEAESIVLLQIPKMENSLTVNYSILIGFYSIYADILTKKGRYEEAWKVRGQIIDLCIARNQKLKDSIFEELQTQYDTEQKQAQNQLLLEKNKVIEANNEKIKQEGQIRALIDKQKLTQSQALSYKQKLDNQSLRQANTSIELQARQYRTWLIASLFVFCLVSLLLFLLYRSVVKQKQLMRFRDKLYTIIVHDLREPINSLQNVGTLLSHLIKNKQSQEISEVTQQLDRMGQQTNLLLNNLLEWGKSNYFDQQSLLQQLDVAPLLNELSQVYKVVAESRGVTLFANIPGTFPLMANPKDLSLIIRNMLDNAIKHSQEGGTIELAAQETPVGQRSIEVRDTGDGIVPDQLAYLQRVFAGKQKPQVGFHGLGLGMVLISEYAKKNKAILRLTSQPTQGTTFSLLF